MPLHDLRRYGARGPLVAQRALIKVARARFLDRCQSSDCCPCVDIKPIANRQSFVVIPIDQLLNHSRTFSVTPRRFSRNWYK